MAKNLRTASEVVEALGGACVLLELGVIDNPQTAAMWKRSNKLPAKTYLALTEGLHLFGYRADPSLWGMTEHSGARAWKRARFEIGGFGK